MINNEAPVVKFFKIEICNVYLRKEKAGTIEKINNSFIFKYSDAWIREKKPAICTSLPVEHGPYVTKELHPFFDNLIAEGWLLGHAEKVFQIDKSNRFAMLLATGESTIGAVKIRPLREGREISLKKYYSKDLMEDDLVSYKVTQGQDNLCSYCLEELTSTEMKKGKSFHLKCSREMWGTTREIAIFLDPTKPLNSFRKTVYGGTISGAQRKGLFKLDGNKLYPTSFGSQYILKPQGGYDELPENEHVTMLIAKKIGLNVPPISLLDVKNMGRVFAIKRFDLVGDDFLKKEDMAQVLQVYSASKYDLSHEKVAKAIINYSSAPMIDLQIYWKRILFCFLIANGDMHLKNWALVENKKMNDRLELSPCYDLLNTRIPIPAEKEDMGLTINGKKRKIQKSYFKRFAKDLKINDKVISSTFDELESWLNIIKEMIPKSYLSEEAKTQYIELAEERYSILTK